METINHTVLGGTSINVRLFCGVLCLIAWSYICRQGFLYVCDVLIASRGLNLHPVTSVSSIILVGNIPGCHVYISVCLSVPSSDCSYLPPQAGGRTQHWNDAFTNAWRCSHGHQYCSQVRGLL